MVLEDKEIEYWETSIPAGWHKMFRQMCGDLREALKNVPRPESFEFMDVKEKYGSMRCYLIPHFNCNDEIRRIIAAYEYISSYVCEHCGAPAEAIVTSNWITSYCNQCWKDYGRHETTEFITFNPIAKYYPVDGNEIVEVDCTDIWNRLYGENV